MKVEITSEVIESVSSLIDLLTYHVDETFHLYQKNKDEVENIYDETFEFIDGLERGDYRFERTERVHKPTRLENKLIDLLTYYLNYFKDHEPNNILYRTSKLQVGLRRGDYRFEKRILVPISKKLFNLKELIKLKIRTVLESFK